MKTIVGALSMFILVFVSCTKNQEIHQLSGEWQLKSLVGGFSPNETFQGDEVLWVLNSEKSLKTKINKVIPQNSRLPIKNDTILSYSYDASNIYFGNHQFNYQIEGNTLKLSKLIESDGILMTFERK